MLYLTAKDLFRIRVLLLSGTIIIVVIVLIDSLSNNGQRIGSLGKNGIETSEIHQELMQVDELLHARLWQLQNMDQQFSSLANEKSDESSLASTNAAIQNNEVAFRKSIDSIDQLGRQYDEKAGNNSFQNLTMFFKTILENRRYLSYARLDLATEDKGAGGYKQAILKLQDELSKKDKIIAEFEDSEQKPQNNLQNAVADKDKHIQTLEAQIQKEQAERQTTTLAMQKLQGELTEKDKMIAALGNKKAPTDQKGTQSLQTALTEKDKQILGLQAQIQKEQSAKNTFSQTIQKLQSEKVEKDKMISALSNIKAPTDSKALAGLQNTVAEKNKQIRDLQTQVEKEQTAKNAFTQSVQRLQTELTEKDKLIAASMNKKGPADQKVLLSLQSAVNEKDKKIRDLQAQAQKDQTEKNVSLQKLQNERVEKDKMIAALSNIKIPQADQKGLANLQNTVAEKNKQIRDLQTQVQKEESDKTNYSQSIQKLQAELIEKNKIIVAWGNNKAPSDQKALLSLQNDIIEKNKRIRSLEDQLKGTALVKNTSYKPAAGESVQDLQQRNTNLRLAYNNTLTQLGVLTRQYNLLKGELQQLKNQ